MKFAIALAAIPFMAAPALAGPYVSTKSELKFSDANYKEAVNQARLGYDWKVGALKPYVELGGGAKTCLLYTSPSPRDRQKSRMPSSA